MSDTLPDQPIDKLLKIMEKLRDPDGGCPWDLEQTYETIAPHTIEEAYEVADAIAEKDMEELKSELGDLMFQTVFYAQMAKEEGHFEFKDVIEGINEKMIRRHPHVFGDKSIETAEAQTIAWEETKAIERAEKSKGKPVPQSALDGIAKTLPSLTRALKLQNRAARVGFDWPDIYPVFDKIQEELGEFREEVDLQSSKDRLEDEFGDILFAVVNLGRHMGLDPETALARTNRKFTTRFMQVEKTLQETGKSIENSSLEEMDEIWTQVKTQEKKAINE
ncbi:nucleoside triphosphate pyrophosphohydrolase [Sneathiella limimaris]|uniref:nucleoside triphosphate pyrophosphohydrolase n=1 Tax=Sneathiella limimaris TaxID=1964213 RepID=UPI00146BE4E9|nr:nucleoside triphosphate pyrophosphohydrolase [Sneathiella limimaris]